ncbi:hypothetical protein AB1Y20_014396 [Prymnesium parvum]|uniref:phosphoacetylglucosamine mutase n=1 Tax=Prymnesium parvum TaxID=97485 RepID=A0AB34IDJ2_PRYPA
MVVAGILSYPKPSAALSYGTAGFRARAELLDSTLYRMGLLAVLRSRSRGGLAVGLMVTASHNGPLDNGIKLVDVEGGMLATAWEEDATRLANAPDDQAEHVLAAIAARRGAAGGDGEVAGGAAPPRAAVFVARDTRTHSARLAAIALEAVGVLEGRGVDMGVLTTPQLHHIVRHHNGPLAAGERLPHPPTLYTTSSATTTDLSLQESTSLAHPPSTPHREHLPRPPTLYTTSSATTTDLSLQESTSLAHPPSTPHREHLPRPPTLYTTSSATTTDLSLQESTSLAHPPSTPHREHLSHPPILCTTSSATTTDLSLQESTSLTHPPSTPHREHVGPREWASEEGYYEMLTRAYATLVPPAARSSDRGPLWIDAACGVGAPKLLAMQEALLALGLRVHVANGVGDGELNSGCGAEHVQKARLPPRGFEARLAGFDRACSLDGDADRLVYHYWTESNEWKLLDGDKIAALFSCFLMEQLAAAKLDKPLRVACVQTAYANGAAGAYIRGLGMEVPMAKTGVKFLHHEALHFDLAVYFEANGHGTILFSDAAVSALLQTQADAEAQGDAPRAAAARCLLATKQLINQAVGDAISDFLLVEAVLCLRGWGVSQWDALYSDLPSRQTKLPVAERAAIATTADETRVTTPPALQPELDALMARFARGRCFVRPSGTEDVVRVYAEAATQAEADELALLTAQATHKLAGGVGEMPDKAVA